MSSHFQLMRDLIRCCLFFDQLEGSLNWGSTRTLHRLNFLLIGYLLKGISKIPEILFLQPSSESLNGGNGDPKPSYKCI